MVQNAQHSATTAPARVRRTGARAIVVVFMLTASGCALQGDLGRVAPSVADQKFGMGKYARLPGLKDQRLNVPLSYNETTLRTRAYALSYTYAHRSTYSSWSGAGQVEPTYLSKPSERLSAAGYVGELNRQRYASPEARLNAIIDDMRADRAQIDGFWSAVQAVYGDDRRRLSEIQLLGDAMLVRNVTGRVQENRSIVDYTLSTQEVRIEGYRQALVRTGAAMPGAGGAGGLELEGLRRRATRLDNDIRRLDERYATALPAPQKCLNRSIADNCRRTF